MKPIVRVDAASGRVARCRRCRQRIVWADEVGWLDPDAGDTYDVCPEDAYGNHDPDPMTVSGSPLR